MSKLIIRFLVLFFLWGFSYIPVSHSAKIDLFSHIRANKDKCKGRFMLWHEYNKQHQFVQEDLNNLYSFMVDRYIGEKPLSKETMRNVFRKTDLLIHNIKNNYCISLQWEKRMKEENKQLKEELKRLRSQLPPSVGT